MHSHKNAATASDLLSVCVFLFEEAHCSSKHEQLCIGGCEINRRRLTSLDEIPSAADNAVSWPDKFLIRVQLVSRYLLSNKRCAGAGLT